MTAILTTSDVDAVCSTDLHRAEDAFDEIKARMLDGVPDPASLHRTRHYLKAIEHILAEKHEMRRKQIAADQIEGPAPESTQDAV